MANGVLELIEMLQTMVSEAWKLPIGNEKCVIESDKVLEILDEMKAQLPTEINEARKLVAVRNDFLASAKREAAEITKNATERASRMVEEQEIMRATKQKCNELITKAENRSVELKRVANEYAEDTLKRTEDAIAQALEEVRQSRTKFRSVAKTPEITPARSVDVDVDMDDDMYTDEE